MRVDRRTVLRRGLVLLLLGASLVLAPGCEQQPPTPTQEEQAKSETAAAPQSAAEALQPTELPPPQLPEAAQQPPESLGAPTGTFVDRAEGTDFRLVCYNVLWNNIFPEVSAQNADRFVRVMRTLNPDVLALQEIGVTDWMLQEDPTARDWQADDVAYLMDAIIPLPDGQWHGHRGKDCVILSRYPLRMTATQTVPAGEREQAIALVDLPDGLFERDLYVMNNHFKCCDPEQFDIRRQQQADAIAAWIRDARSPGDEIDLPEQTPIIVCGDLNIVGAFTPVETLLTGDVANEAQYGPDFSPDWDDTPLADARPLHNVVGPDVYTWRSDRQERERGYEPTRMDFVIYTDSVLESLQAFVLNTTLMTPEQLAATGLEKLDVTTDTVGEEFDHLPLVVDFKID